MAFARGRRRPWARSASCPCSAPARRETSASTRRCTARTARCGSKRFYPDFHPDEECHIGERIVRDDGTVEYMKTFRLSGAQVRRAYLLSKLAEAGWDLARAATALATTKRELVKRLENAGFGYLLKPHIVRGAGDGVD